MMSYKKTIENVLMACLIVGHISWFIPHEMVLDSLSMYHDAQALMFRDYWPSLTLIVWHMLGYIYPGAEPMIILQLGFLWGAALIGYCLFRGRKIAYWFLLIPFYPNIFWHAGLVLKDNIFSFGYMFLTMCLAYKTYHKKTLSWWETILIVLGVFYFSLVKIQAQFIFPFMLFWILTLQPFYRTTGLKNKLRQGAILVSSCIVFLWGMNQTNTYLVQEKNTAHFWQFVKIYDLAGMSVFSGNVYVPEFLWKHETITVADIEKAYDYLWEPLIRYPDSPLRETQSDAEREQLVETWWACVLKDPLAYAKHRGRLIGKILSGSVVKGEFVEYATKYYPQWLKWSPIFSVFSFLSALPLLIVCLLVGFRYRHSISSAMPAFLLAAMGGALIAVLSVFSLASAARYIYFSWCCLMFAIPFAYDTFQQRRKVMSF